MKVLGESNFYRPQTKFAKVMFYRCLSVHGGRAWRGGMRSTGRVWQGAMHGRADTTGYGQWAGGTHPTGMHSCWFCFCLSSSFHRLQMKFGPRQNFHRRLSVQGDPPGEPPPPPLLYGKERAVRVLLECILWVTKAETKLKWLLTSTINTCQRHEICLRRYIALI